MFPIRSNSLIGQTSFRLTVARLSGASRSHTSTAGLKNQRDFDARNCAEGDSAWLQFAMPFLTAHPPFHSSSSGRHEPGAAMREASGVLKQPYGGGVEAAGIKFSLSRLRSNWVVGRRLDDARS